MSSAGKGYKRVCECCKKRKCNKIFRMPIGRGARSRVVLVCGRCVMQNASRTRDWLNKLEEELNEG